MVKDTSVKHWEDLGGPWEDFGSSFLSSLGGLWEDFGSSLGGLWEDFWSFILYIIKSQKSNSVKLQRVLMMGDALGQGYFMMLFLKEDAKLENVFGLLHT